MIRVKLDGNIVTTPENWKELTSKIKREDAYNGLLIYQESEVEFTDDGYDYLRGKLNDEGFCSVVEVIVDRSCDDDTSWQLMLRGKIFISDVSYNERTCRASAKIEDTSFFSLIKNNGKIKTSLDTFLTKNGLPIASYTPYTVDFYDVPSNSLVVAIAVPTVSIYDAFAYLISFMSDNQVGFASTLFGPGGDWEGLCVTTGKRIRLQTPEAWEQISFNELFEEVMAATEELKLIVEDPYGSPTIRIERASYTYGNPITLNLTDVYEINTSCMTQKLYTSVNVGSQVLEDNIAYAFPEDIDYFGFKTEELFLQGKCNVDNSLDITGNWVRSSNVIEKSLGPSTDYDNNIVLLDTEVQSPGAGRTTNTNTFDLVPAYYFYNDRLRNSEIMARWVGGLPGSIVKYLGSVGDGIFEATKTATQTLNPVGALITQITFTNEVSDVGNYYNALDTYTAAITGTYVMNINMLYTITFNPGVTGVFIRYGWRVYDSGGNLKYQNYSGYIPVVDTFPSGTVNLTRTLVMNAGDYARVFSYVDAGATSISTNPGSNWKCIDNTVGGGVFQTIDPADYPVLLHEFEYPITEDQFALLVADPTGRIQFNMNNQASRAAWIEDISYNHITKLGSFKLVTSRNAN